MTKRQDPPIVVDGSNMAWMEKTKDGKPRLANIVAVRKRLIDLGYRPIVIVDAALVHQIDDAPGLESLIDKSDILQAPADTDADYFVLKTAQIEVCPIVTDDMYRDHLAEFADAVERRVPVMIVDGNVEFYHLKPAPAAGPAGGQAAGGQAAGGQAAGR